MCLETTHFMHRIGFRGNACTEFVIKILFDIAIILYSDTVILILSLKV